MTILLAALLALPAFAQDSSTSTVRSEAAMPLETQEFMQWTSRRIGDLKLGDDQIEAVWLHPEKPRRLSAMARLIAQDRRLLWR